MVDNGFEIPKQSAIAAQKSIKEKFDVNAHIIDCLNCKESFRSRLSEERKYCSTDCYYESKRIN